LRSPTLHDWRHLDLVCSKSSILLSGEF